MTDEREWTWSWPGHLTFDGNPGYGLICASREEAEAEADLSYMTIVSRLPGETEWQPGVHP